MEAAGVEANQYDGAHDERGRSTYVAQFAFVLKDQVPNAVVPVNPLGLTITYFRVDQGFK